MNVRDKKELYKAMTDSMVYLPIYQLDLLVEELETRRKKESIFKLICEFQKREELQKYNNPLKGYFSIENEHHIWSRNNCTEIIQIQPYSNKEIKRHKSMYAAAKSIGIPDGFGNISKCVRGKIKTAYGFIWKKVDK